jgi:hypothetical protein
MPTARGLAVAIIPATSRMNSTCETNLYFRPVSLICTLVLRIFRLSFEVKETGSFS